VRVVVPISSGDPNGEEKSQRTAIEFTKVLFGQLDRFLPA
jgi:hypothetical protein